MIDAATHPDDEGAGQGGEGGDRLNEATTSRFEKLLHAFLAATRARAGTCWVRAGDDFVVAASTHAGGAGLSTARVSASAVQGWEPRWVGSALLLPLRVGDHVVGIVRLEEAESTSATFEAACALADVTAHGLASSPDAQLPDFAREGESGCYPLAFFLLHIEKEVAVARRYRRVLALIYATLDNYHELLEVSEPRLVRGAARRLLRAIQAVTRDADVVTRPRDGEFAVLLPETDTLGGFGCARRIANLFMRGEAMSRLVHILPLALSMGVAAFPNDAESGDALIARARSVAEFQKTSIIRRFGLEFQSLWDIIVALMRDQNHYATSRSGRLYLHPTLRPFDDVDGNTRHGFFSAALTDAVARELAVEVAHHTTHRGYFIMLESEPRTEAAAEAFLALCGTATRATYIVGYPVTLPSQANVVVLPLDRTKIPETRLLLYFGESGAYTMVTRPSSDRGPFGFHSSDPLLAELLVSRIHETFRGAKGV